MVDGRFPIPQIMGEHVPSRYFDQGVARLSQADK
jgi:hypothetical protein